MLHDELAKIHQVSVTAKEPVKPQGVSYCNLGDNHLIPPQLSDDSPEIKSLVKENTSTPWQSQASGTIPATMVSPAITASTLDTPTVQRVVVEHIVKAN